MCWTIFLLGRQHTAIPQQDGADCTFAATPCLQLRAQRFFFQGDLQSLGLGHLVGQELLQFRALPIEFAQDADYLLGGASCLLNR